MKTKYLIILTIILIIAIAACEKPQMYPNEPSIEFIKVRLKDTIDNETLQNEVKRIELFFQVVDGDGNVGLNQEDTFDRFHFDSLYYHNLFIYFHKKIDGEYVNSDTLKYRVPYYEPIGQNKYIKADIKVIYNLSKELIDFDTVAMEFFVVDRSFTHSNTIWTPDMPIDFNGYIVDSTEVN